MNSKTLRLFAAALLVSAAACNKDLTSINTNPNGPVSVPPPSLLSQVIQDAVADFHGPNNNVDIRGGGLWVQYYAEIQYRDEDKYIVRPGTDAGWGEYNGALENSQRMIVQGDATKTPNWSAVGRIMKSYIFSEMTDAMGDLPYSQALKGDTNLTPAYDTQQQIYAGLFKDLATADSEIVPGGIGFSSGDLMYNGDMNEWRKFANSLRLRLALHLSNVDATTGKAMAQAALTAGVFDSNGDNAQLLYLASSPNQNPVYTNVHVDVRDDYGLSKTLVDSLLSWNDPRLPIYAQLDKPLSTDTLANGTPIPPHYEGLPNGLNDGAGTPIRFVSRIGAYWRETPNAPLPLMTYSEVLFLEAEAAERTWIAGNAAVLYDSAIAASMEQYGISGSAIATYLADPRVVYTPGATGLAQIAYQKWVSLFLQGVEAWTEVRRTGVPAIVPGINAVLPKMPERLPYANSEEVLNKTNVEAAVARQKFANYADLQKPLWFTGRQ